MLDDLPDTLPPTLDGNMLLGGEGLAPQLAYRGIAKAVQYELATLQDGEHVAPRTAGVLLGSDFVHRLRECIQEGTEVVL